MGNLSDESEMEMLADRARTIYDERLKAILEPQFNGQSVAIDVDSGDYEVNRSWTLARQTLRHRRSDAHICSFFIGPPTNEEFALATRMSAGRNERKYSYIPRRASANS